MNKLLVVDDDPEIASLLCELLEIEGFEVVTANNGVQALEKFDSTIDLILLDIMMPEMNGLSVLSQLRNKYTVPVIFLTAKDNEFDKIIGLELGADDYILKPFNDRELVARINALLRRKRWDNLVGGFGEKSIQYTIDKLTVNRKQQSVSFDDKYIELTGTEFQILLKLLENAGKIISRDTLSETVLGKEFIPLARSIDVHVSNLRKKLPPRSDGLPWIKTLRSKGYLFVVDQSDELLHN
ncbi:DNA-binding response regulator [Gilliamella sp. Choc4-2]|jgi:two-component system, OmpR family, response regulator CpxR|uniref:response regulator n=1 Tax=unclassified Gilliamella TaxID=2685620 RepID=UPI0004DD13F0|nr:response regulator [Gilliamella apicola]KFA59875.1 Copper-sensing two-component system response regulator CpxR [Gilliamella apicola]OCG30328.1 DNA-binding response regulator [Gilliamella apicola]OCG47268.1 DNA-binding response regulator [Gilliamella apicola]OCG55382.1 DNA-binding response regulator [Gilliamella apicola]OCG63117.1 DNA-binding response regulator [Gilliamella apicola]